MMVGWIKMEVETRVKNKSRKESNMKYVIKEICDNGKRNIDPWYHRYASYSDNQRIVYDDLEKATRDAEATVNMRNNGVIGYSIEKIN